MPTVESQQQFLVEYAALCVKHAINMGGCGCCGSPFLVEVEDGEMLGYTGDFEDVKFGSREYHGEGAFVLEDSGEFRQIPDEEDDADPNEGETIIISKNGEIINAKRI